MIGIVALEYHQVTNVRDGFLRSLGSYQPCCPRNMLRVIEIECDLKYKCKSHGEYKRAWNILRGVGTGLTYVLHVGLN